MLKVCYTPHMSSDSANDLVISAKKPELFMNALKALGLPHEIVSVEPLTPEDLSTAHDLFYVKDILKGRKANGFMNYSKKIAATLPYTSGSMFKAALTAIKERTIVCSPTSGFHHARYDEAGGFCTFNGLVIASQLLRRQGVRKVGILDCDRHYGDGTDEIISRLKLDSIEHWSFGNQEYTQSQIKYFLSGLRPILLKMKTAGCEVILYQAGADPHVNDNLGGLMTTEELIERDRIVFETCVELNLPVAFNLAGGYQKNPDDTVNLHINTVRMAAKTLALP